MDVKVSKRICVLEDNEEILEILTMVLEEEHYIVFGFGTVSTFLASAEDLKPHVCLLDVMLPDGNGLQVCRDLKGNPQMYDVPVIIMTANSHIEKMKDDCDADDFITKPFDINDLAERVNLQAKRKIYID